MLTTQGPTLTKVKGLTRVVPLSFKLNTPDTREVYEVALLSTIKGFQKLEHSPPRPHADSVPSSGTAKNRPVIFGDVLIEYAYWCPVHSPKPTPMPKVTGNARSSFRLMDHVQTSKAALHFLLVNMN